jgi:hypothetical protein
MFDKVWWQNKNKNCSWTLIEHHTLYATNIGIKAELAVNVIIFMFELFLFVNVLSLWSQT